jgi:hypothetical protein
MQLHLHGCDQGLVVPGLRGAWVGNLVVTSDQQSFPRTNTNPVPAWLPVRAARLLTAHDVAISATGLGTHGNLAALLPRYLVYN